MNSLVRRRSLMAGKGGIQPASDGYIWAYYQVDDISAATPITAGGIFISEMIVDGISVTPSNTFQFQNIGRHLVKYKFSSNSSVNGFHGIGTLVELYFPDDFQWNYLSYAWLSRNDNLRIIDLGQKITWLKTAITNCPNLEEIRGFENLLRCERETVFLSIEAPKLQYPDELNPNYSGRMFTLGSASHVPLATFTKIPVGVTAIGSLCFRQCNNIPYLHFLNLTTPPTLGTNNPFYSTSFKLYVGDGTSAEADEAVKAIYLADTEWAKYSARLDTWYNYLHSN